MEEANAALVASDFKQAKSKAAEAVSALLARTDSEQTDEWIALLDSAAVCAMKVQDTATARLAWGKLLELRARTLADDDPKLERVRINLASVLRTSGDLEGTRALEEKVLEIRTRLLSDDDLDLQRTRHALAATLSALGDVERAHELFTKALDVRMRKLPEDHPELQYTRQGLAVTKKTKGDLAGARALEEAAVEAFERSRPSDHPDLQFARQNLGETLYLLGELTRSRALLEQVYEVRARTMPDDHLTLQGTRFSLANVMEMQGDSVRARALLEKALAVRSRKLREDHPDVQKTRTTLSRTLARLGDVAGARVLAEQALEISSRKLPSDHLDLQIARERLASALRREGKFEAAHELYKQVYEVQTRTQPEDSSRVQSARHNLAMIRQDLGDFEGACELQRQVLATLLRTLPEDDLRIQRARTNLAGTLRVLGDVDGAIALFERALDASLRSLPQTDGYVLQKRLDLATTLLTRAPAGGPGNREAAGATQLQRAASSTRDAARSGTQLAREIVASVSAREADERCSRLSEPLSVVLSICLGYGSHPPLRELVPDAFAFAESTRGAAIDAAAMTRRASQSPECGGLRSELRKASEEFAAVAQKGAGRDEFESARRKREAAEQKLVEFVKDRFGSDFGAPTDAAAVSKTLRELQAAIGFRRFTRWSLERSNDSSARAPSTAVESLCAFVVRSPTPSAADASSVALVDLGAIEPIARAVRAWREGLGVVSGRGAAASPAPAALDLIRRGDAVRRHVFDPLKPALANVSHVVIALDDVLHLVPFDALPADEKGSSLLGDHFRIETRATLTELLAPPSPLRSENVLLALGGASFDEAPLAPNVLEGEPAPSPAPLGEQVAALLRGSAWSAGFPPLQYTGVEAHEIAAQFERAFEGSSRPRVLEKRKASRTGLNELAPDARFLHIATHGWFAPESIPMWNDAAPLDQQSGLGTRMTSEELAKGMSPMLLCGLALAGANLGDGTLGGAQGLLTADELSTLDLTNCELAVLSACDTNVGEHRAGQGVASLQKALQMAGARSVITSLWKVPDEATKDLMLDFYRRLWFEGKPKWRALWEAKVALRDAKDAQGAPMYSIRDWAAWILTGAPD